jgi:hypothetical protein
MQLAAAQWSVCGILEHLCFPQDSRRPVDGTVAINEVTSAPGKEQNLEETKAGSKSGEQHRAAHHKGDCSTKDFFLNIKTDVSSIFYSLTCLFAYKK